MKKEIRKIRNRLAGVRDEALEETQLTLNLKKEELFDSHIVLPHPEVNQVVYDAVDRFVERYSGESMAITIMSGDVNPSLQGCSGKLTTATTTMNTRRRTDISTGAMSGWSGSC